jgi:hypothetical protein
MKPIEPTIPWRMTMRMKVQEVGPGLHPSEVVVEVNTVTGPERLVVDRNAVSDKTLFVGWRSLAQKAGQLLVELPSEAMSGTSRVWVTSEEILPERNNTMGAT